MKCDSSTIWINTKPTLVFVLLVIVTLLCGIAVHGSFDHLRTQYSSFKTHESTNDNLYILNLHTNNDILYRTLNPIDRKEIIKRSIDSAKQLANLEPEDAEIAAKTMLKPLFITNKTIDSLFSKERDINFEEMALEQYSRTCRFRRMCKTRHCDKQRLNGTVGIFFSENRRLAWRLTPDVGSTILTQTLGILDDNATGEVFDKSTGHINIGGDTFAYKSFDSSTLQNYTVILMASNPFARLFSAFMDKVVLPNDIDLDHHINRNATNKETCPFTNSFEDLLRHALTDTNKKRKLRRYAPIVPYSECNKICQIPNIIVVKQENFTKDLDYALKLTGVGIDIHKVVHENHLQSTVPDIVKTTYNKMLEYELSTDKRVMRMLSNKCLTWTTLAQRLWAYFQFQGYITEKINFPHQLFQGEAQYRDEKYITQVILEFMKKHAMTEEQRNEQRAKAMTKAYSKVSSDTLLKIKDIYSLDFHFFDYGNEMTQE